MSNYYTASEDFSNPIRPGEKKSAIRIEKGLKTLLIIAAVILIGQFVWLFVLTPFFPFTVIEVHGIDGLSRPEILFLAGINEASSFFSANTREIQNILSGHILVDSAVVMRRFPDRLSIFLTPREAVAVTLTTAGSRQEPLFIDRHGVFFKIGNDLSSLNVPVISGMENPRINMRLPDALLPLAANLYELGNNAPELLSAISEIRIERKAWAGYDLVVFPVHSSTRVRVNNLTEDVLRYMLLILNVFEAQNERPEEIDFRSGIGSYILRN